MTERSKPSQENSVDGENCIDVENCIEDSHLAHVGFPNRRSTAITIVHILFECFLLAAFAGRAGAPAPHNLLNQRPIPRRLIRRNHHRRSYPVSRLNVQQSHSLRRPTRFADELRLDADDLAILADQHHL